MRVVGWITLALGLAATAPAAVTEVDVCIFGGTSAGVMAAVQTVAMGKSVVLLEPGAHVGGLSSGGLGFTDIGYTTRVPHR